MTSTPSAIEALVERISAERAAAAGQMAALGGDSSACALGRDGRSFPAYKYFEGQAAGYGTLIRWLRRADESAIADVVRAVVEEGRADVDRRAGSGRDWEAYAQGVLDAALAADAMSPP